MRCGAETRSRSGAKLWTASARRLGRRSAGVIRRCRIRRRRALMLEHVDVLDFAPQNPQRGLERRVVAHAGLDAALVVGALLRLGLGDALRSEAGCGAVDDQPRGLSEFLGQNSLDDRAAGA